MDEATATEPRNYTLLLKPPNLLRLEMSVVPKPLGKLFVLVKFGHRPEKSFILIVILGKCLDLELVL